MQENLSVEAIKRREEIANNSIRLGDMSFSFKIDSNFEESDLMLSSCIEECRKKIA